MIDDTRYQNLNGLTTNQQAEVGKIVEMMRRDNANIPDKKDDYRSGQASCGMSSGPIGELMPTPTRARSFALPHGIGWAIEQIHDHRAVTRAGWNGKGMWIALQIPDSHSHNTLPYVYIITAQGERVPWLASQTDLLANDWQLL